MTRGLSRSVCYPGRAWSAGRCLQSALLRIARPSIFIEAQCRNDYATLLRERFTFANNARNDRGCCN